MLEIIHTHFFYFCLLVFSITGLTLADWRYKLAFWNNPIASALAIGSVWVLLLLFDIGGIRNQIFSTNQSYVIGIHIVSPNLPIEEFLFLFILCYVTLLLYQILKKVDFFNNKKKVKI
ncbi:lycopene cyclase domain-containing protein [Candidatus Saccharibacteria bacterium]|nr:lycopene cyclase domain-containing protein [Candidatus Saccharibacteria bacterium]